MILMSIVFAVLTLLMLMSYLNAIKTSDNDLLVTVSKTLNITFVVFMILGLIIGSMIYYLCIIHIEDLNKQCYINLSVFFASLFLIAVFAIGGTLVEHNNHRTEHPFLKTLINFFLLITALIIAVSAVLILTIVIMSCFWCLQIRANKTAFRRSSSNEVRSLSIS